MENIKKAAMLLKQDEIVAMPTETVYGLAASILSKVAVEKIFKAKGRPQDNPLIVHISSVDELSKYAKDINPLAFVLYKAFKGMPLSIVLNKNDIIPDVVSAGLKTVAIRIPNNDIAIALIKELGAPIAAPSANLSGLPSPTTAEEVFDDLNGKIPAILDGGKCAVGVESTVLSLVSDTPVLLRPGFVTFEMLKEYLPNIKMSESIFKTLKKDEVVSCPGMKYKHYAPKTKLCMLSGDMAKIEQYLAENVTDDKGVICFEETKVKAKNKFIYGKMSDANSCNHLVYSVLREIDEYNLNLVYVVSGGNDKEFLAIYNRLIKACSHNEIKF
ncbi:MAG: L-threonylcarbamoyladenylate synthase [Clostridia bacterium]